MTITNDRGITHTNPPCDHTPTGSTRWHPPPHAVEPRPDWPWLYGHPMAVTDVNPPVDTEIPPCETR